VNTDFIHDQIMGFGCGGTLTFVFVLDGAWICALAGPAPSAWICALAWTWAPGAGPGRAGAIADAPVPGWRALSPGCDDIALISDGETRINAAKFVANQG
jgi:hypothetical protein